MNKLIEIENIQTKDTQRIQIHLPKKTVQDLDEFCKFNKIKSRKKLIEILIIKFAKENKNLIDRGILHE